MGWPQGAPCRIQARFTRLPHLQFDEGNVDLILAGPLGTSLNAVLPTC